MKDRFARYALIWVLLLATIWLGDRFVRSSLLTADQPRTVTARGDLAEAERHRIALFENAAPSVVYLFTEGPGRAGERRAGAGSGFVWDAAGHVVTNHHVIDGATRVRVRLDSGAAIDAKVVGSAPDQDLAVVKLAETREILHAIPVGRSIDLKVGQSVFAIGNPFGLNRSLTAGIISALDRRLPTASNREIAGVIQVDAAINPGNSGGPLLDSAGRLIGVTTAILSETGSFAGVGFAVPVDVVNRIVPGLIRDGRGPRPGIGIMAAPELVGRRRRATRHQPRVGRARRRDHPRRRQAGELDRRPVDPARAHRRRQQGAADGATRRPQPLGRRRGDRHRPLTAPAVASRPIVRPGIRGTSSKALRSAPIGGRCARPTNQPRSFHMSFLTKQRVLIAAALLALTGLVQACNTVEGAGKDVKHAGQGIENEARKDK